MCLAFKVGVSIGLQAFPCGVAQPDPRPRDHAEMQTYTPAEIRAVLRAADTDRNGHLWYLALPGLRRGEIAGLRWCDVDFKAGTITVARSRVELGGGPCTVLENEPKSLASRRTLPLADGLLGVLRRASACVTHKRSSRSARCIPRAAVWQSMR
jgi:integrase